MECFSTFGVEGSFHGVACQISRMSDINIAVYTSSKITVVK